MLLIFEDFVQNVGMGDKWRNINQYEWQTLRLRIFPALFLGAALLSFGFCVMLRAWNGGWLNAFTEEGRKAEILPAKNGASEEAPREEVQFVNSSYNSFCTDVEFVYVRGSGQALGDSEEWRQFQAEAKKLADRNGYTYKIYDLDYPAVAINKPAVAVGAFVSAGDAFKFGRSVEEGVNNLNQHRAVMDIHCPLTRWVVMGYSQGALVAMDALPKFNPKTFAYVALLGDPKTYLPEGKGIFPVACSGGAPSPYRIYVPECRTYRGILGARNPYVPEGYMGKVGLWCNRDDIICGSTKNVFKMEGHSQYRDNGSIPWVLREMDYKLAMAGAQSHIYEKTYGKPEGTGDDMLPMLPLPASAAKMPARGALAVNSQTKPSDDLLVQSSLNALHYYAKPGEMVTFDASQSFSLIDNGELFYWWRFSDEDATVLGSPVMQHSFAKPGEYKVRFSLTDGASSSEQILATVTVAEDVEKNFAADLPVEDVFLLRRDQYNLKIAWPQQALGAKYLWVKVNGVPVTIVMACERSITLTDMEYAAETSLELAWLDEDFNLGEEIQYRLADVAEYDAKRDSETLDLASACGLGGGSSDPTPPETGLGGGLPSEGQDDTPPEEAVPTGVRDLDRSVALGLCFLAVAVAGLGVKIWIAKTALHRKTKSGFETKLRTRSR